MRFCKMQGTGNDYVYINLFEEQVENPGELAVQFSKPHFGICADGLVLIGPSQRADFSMRIFNSDGSEGEMCGNACRCVAKYLYERGLTRLKEIALETGAGIRRLWLTVEGGEVVSVRVDMGAPVLEPGRIPVSLRPGEDPARLSLSVDGEKVTVTCVSMGNPHAVIFVDDPAAAPVETLGPKIEKHPAFPHHTNVEFVHTENGRIRMRVWERGAGETLSCGTGACAALAASVLTGRCRRDADVELPGGTIRVWWDADGHIYQEGGADFVFDGIWPDSVMEEMRHASNQ